MLLIQDFHRRFGSEDQCLSYLFSLRFSEATCPKCGRENAYHKHPTKQCYTCNCGQSHIYPRKGTIFENSPLPLTKWFYAIFLFCKSGDMPAKELERQLSVAYPTAWRMNKRLQSVAALITLRADWQSFDAAITRSL